jgi:hypothetical protein
MQPILVHRTTASRSGAEVADYPEEHRRSSSDLNELRFTTRLSATEEGNDFGERFYGRQIRVKSSDLRPVVIRSSSAMPRRVVTTLLNCEDINPGVYEQNLAAFTSEFGFISKTSALGAYQYVSVDFLKACISWLKRLREACQNSDAIGIHAISEKLSANSRAIYFEPRLEDGKLIPELVAPSLQSFCMHELMTIYFEGNTITSCLHCAKLTFSQGRSDQKYCSPRCRVAAHRRGKGAHIQ